MESGVVKDAWGESLKAEKARSPKHLIAFVTKTYHEGANDERTAVLAKIRRMIREGTIVPIRDLETWILQRNERYKKNPGGL